ncbi:MAG TPA: protein kinase [Phycisphaerae bacterium]|nr:protein kinase [Phycisphaerae bacterium]
MSADDTITISCLQTSFPSAAQTDIVVPRQLGAVRLIRELGRGGMGSVWLGRDEMLGRDVAVKFLLNAVTDPDDPDFGRFLDGARAAAAVRHSCLTAMYAAELIEGVPYLLMEYVNGPTVAAMIEHGGALEQSAALAIMDCVADALGELHERNIIHRDIKPANVLLDGEGHVFVTDFGLTHRRASSGREKNVAGTPAYMAPEMFEGSVSPRSDVYALGITLFECLTGLRPFPVGGPEMTGRQPRGPMPTDCLRECKVPDAVIEVIQRAVHVNPMFRHKSAANFRQALREAQGEKTNAQRGTRAIAALVSRWDGKTHEADPSREAPALKESGSALKTATYFDEISSIAARKRVLIAEQGPGSGSRGPEPQTARSSDEPSVVPARLEKSKTALPVGRSADPSNTIPISLAHRIRKRPYCFVLSSILLVMLVGLPVSFHKGIGYYGETVHVVTGFSGLMIDLNPRPSELRQFHVINHSNPFSFSDSIRLFFGLPKKEVTGYFIPLGWPLLLAAGIVSFFFWRPIRIFAPHHCQSCGYSLRGITTAICPECGNKNEGAIGPVHDEPSALADDANRNALPRMPSTGTIPCVKCDYDLRGLEVQSKCPECDTAVADSAGDDRLVFASPRWLRRIRLGLTILWGSAALAMVLISLPFLFMEMGIYPSDSVVEWLGMTICFGLPAAFSVGVWLSTSREPGGHRGGRVRMYAVLARVAILISAVTPIFLYSAKLLQGRSIVTATIVAALCAIILFGGVAGFGLFLTRLLARIPAPKLARRLRNSSFVTAAVVATVPLLFVFGKAMGTAHTILVLATPVVLIWYWFGLGKCQRALKRVCPLGT